jgi:hypothetical protein
VSVFLSAALFEKDGTTLIKRLDTSYNRQWLDERDGDGSFGFSLPFEDSGALISGRIVKFSWGTQSNDWVFAGVIESVTVSKTGGNTTGEDRIADIGGRGVRCLLENALVYPVSGNATRTFSGVSAGSIIRTLITEAQARGVLTELSTDFTNTTDSNGVGFSKVLTLNENAGTSLAEVATRHTELAVDINITPDFVLQYFNNRGTDWTASTPTVALRVGSNIGELRTEKAGPVKNTVLVGYGTNQFVTRANSSSVTSYGRKETFLNLSNTNSSTHADLAGDQVLSVSASPSDGITVQLSADGAQPYLNFYVGDYVWVHDHTGARTKYRVSSISVTETEDGSVSFVPELGTLRADLTRRLNRALARLEAKNANGTATTDLTPGGGIGGQIVVLPGGVILPATVSANYPFDREAADTAQGWPYGFTAQSLAWSVEDLSSIGFYTRTLVSSSSNVTGTAFINMDSLAYTQFASSVVPSSTNASAFKLINGSLYHFGTSISQFDGATWVPIVNNIVSKPFQVGSIWYALHSTIGLLAFDETTELVSTVASLPATGGGTFRWATIGNGSCWFAFQPTGTSAIRVWHRPTSVSGSWTNVFLDYGFVSGPAVSTALDGDLLAYQPPSSGAVGTGVLHRVDKLGTITTTSDVAGYLDDLRAAGKYIEQHANLTYVNAVTGGGQTLAEVGSYLGAHNSEWILVGTTYTDTDASSGRGSNAKWRIDAVGPQGYCTVVPETDAGNFKIGSENFTWSPGGENYLRVSSNAIIYEYSINLTLP